ncbi:MAG TPA: methylthioribulose 1-phosphate dehydratase [Pyrinomonadaceae bacterium]|nr:methylthioribulose 1-phosphate dehydratase [Pyrinomonadaceae bacterium]
MPAKQNSLTEELAIVGRSFHGRGWLRGSSGNFSVLLARKPTRLCITSAGDDIGDLDETNFLELDEDAEILQGFGRPSDGSLLHLAIYRMRPRARCVLYSQSVPGIILTDKNYVDGVLEFSGYEALASLDGIDRFDQSARVPIIDNSKDHVALSHVIANVLSDDISAVGIFIRKHGLYTWGETVKQARTNIEILEFLFEIAVNEKQ